MQRAQREIFLKDRIIKRVGRRCERDSCIENPDAKVKKAVLLRFSEVFLCDGPTLNESMIGKCGLEI